MLLKVAMFLIVSSVLVMMARMIAAQIEASKARAKVVARRRNGTALRRDPATGIYYPER